MAVKIAENVSSGDKGKRKVEKDLGWESKEEDRIGET